jgi:hypothetical protein
VTHPISNSFTDSYKRFRGINYWWFIPLVIHPDSSEIFKKERARKLFGGYIIGGSSH